MKYFKLELLKGTSIMSNHENEILDKLWMDNLTNYWEQFKSYEDRMPSRFVKEYCRHAFHDYNIESMNFYKDLTKKKPSHNVDLKVCLDDNKFIIKYIDVTKLFLDVNINKYIYNNTFLYSEILPVDSTKMSHEILFADKNTIYIEFKKIIFKREP